MARKRKGKSDSRHYHHWLDRAGEDVLAARALLENDNCYNSAAFHCQQTVEKCLKAYLLFRTGKLLDGHNLPWLCKQAMRHHHQFQDWLDESVALNRCYIETRYPADIPLDLTFQQVRSYYTMAHRMFLFTTTEIDRGQDAGSMHPSQKKSQAKEPSHA